MPHSLFVPFFSDVVAHHRSRSSWREEGQREGGGQGQGSGLREAGGGRRQAAVGGESSFINNKIPHPQV
jgi:hypothetical protein